MEIANYISDLLYRYECVIVPDFGGFVTNEVSAQVNHFTHTFYPPTKLISFNSHLQNNDGLLANHIASVENISFEKALSLIKQETEVWIQSFLNDEAVEIPKIGTLELNKDQKIVFEPVVSQNYLTSSFGLSSYASPAIKRLEEKVRVRQLQTVAPILSGEKRKTPVFLKYAASAAVLFMLGSIGWNSYNNDQYEEQVLADHQKQEAHQQKIQQATFVITNPLPTITLNVAKEIKNYHIVAGAFREVGNAEKKVEQLIEEGFDAQVLGVNKWNLTQVSYGSYSDKFEALKSLRTIKRTVSSEAWLLVHQF